MDVVVEVVFEVQAVLIDLDFDLEFFFDLVRAENNFVIVVLVLYPVGRNNDLEHIVFTVVDLENTYFRFDAGETGYRENTFEFVFAARRVPRCFFPVEHLAELAAGKGRVFGGCAVGRCFEDEAVFFLVERGVVESGKMCFAVRIGCAPVV